MGVFGFDNPKWPYLKRPKQGTGERAEFVFIGTPVKGWKCFPDGARYPTRGKRDDGVSKLTVAMAAYDVANKTIGIVEGPWCFGKALDRYCTDNPGHTVAAVSETLRNADGKTWRVDITKARDLTPAELNELEQADKPDLVQSCRWSDEAAKAGVGDDAAPAGSEDGTDFYGF